MLFGNTNCGAQQTQAVGPWASLRRFQFIRFNDLAYFETIGKTLAITALILCLLGCTPLQTEGFYRGEEKTMVSEPNQAAVTGSVTIVGKRITIGNAVDCPEIETSDGQRIAVKGLTGEHNIGATVRVTGRYGYVTSCNGLVLAATSVTIIG